MSDIGRELPKPSESTTIQAAKDAIRESAMNLGETNTYETQLIIGKAPHPKAINQTPTPGWIDNPSFQPENLVNGDQSNSQSVRKVNAVLYEVIFGGKGPEETGYVFSTKRLHEVAHTGNKYTQQMRVYRLPIVENAQDADDFLYAVIPVSDLYAQRLITGFVEKDGEKVISVLGTPVVSGQDYGAWAGSGHKRNFGYLDEERIDSLLKGIAGEDKFNELAPPATSSTPALT